MEERRNKTRYDCKDYKRAYETIETSLVSEDERQMLRKLREFSADYLKEVAMSNVKRKGVPMKQKKRLLEAYNQIRSHLGRKNPTNLQILVEENIFVEGLAASIIKKIMRERRV